MVSVYVAEYLDEQSSIQGVYVSLEAAVAGIKAQYPPPYVAEWKPLHVGGTCWMLSADFEKVEGYSCKHSATWKIARWDVGSAAAAGDGPAQGQR